MSTILSRWRSGRLAQNYSLWAGLALFLVLLLVAYVVPAVFQIDTSEINFDSSLQSPNLQYLFGTDDLGRQVLWRSIEALKTDLEIVAVCVLIPFVTGSLIGLISGYVGGWLDTLIMRVVDIVWAFPFYVLVIAIVGSLGPSTQNMYLAFTLVVWISFARIVRGEVLLVKTTEYVQSARVMGYSHFRIIFLHILPNVITPAIVFMMADVVLTILAVTSLGFLGLGIQPPTPELGVMIAEGRNYIFDAWWISVFPGIMIIYIGVTFSLLGDGIDNQLRVKS